VFYEDECHFRLTLGIIRAWFLAGFHPEIKSPVDKFKVSIFGAMGKNGQLITVDNEEFNAQTFRLFLEKLLLKVEVGRKENGRKKKILLVLDNAKSQYAKILQPRIEEVSNILELFFLPPCSPDLNAIRATASKKFKLNNKCLPSLYGKGNIAVFFGCRRPASSRSLSALIV
jgi:transposase